MPDPIQILSNLRRPRLLIRAARFGMTDYNRDRDLKRLTHTTSIPTPERAVSNLMAEESRLEGIRKSGDAAYSVSRHVEILIALMAEVQLLPKGPQLVS
ncbi:MAG: hypothetical protein KUG69_00580 [Marinosulfonomonas sp.]|nr:hypothetical protein [Marinosulfonomonas sp.]